MALTQLIAYGASDNWLIARRDDLPALPFNISDYNYCSFVCEETLASERAFIDATIIDPSCSTVQDKYKNEDKNEDKHENQSVTDLPCRPGISLPSCQT